MGPVVEDKPHKPMKKHHSQHNMAPAGDDPNITETGCVALEKKSDQFLNKFYQKSGRICIKTGYFEDKQTDKPLV